MLPLLFDWDESNENHVARHGVTPDEAEDALLDPLRMGAPAYIANGERRCAFIGSTGAGRTLFVVTTRRRRRIRVVTARDLSEREGRQYRRQRQSE